LLAFFKLYMVNRPNELDEIWKLCGFYSKYVPGYLYKLTI